MTVTVKHPFVSAVADSADTSLVRPSNWNADHTIIGLGTAAEKDVGVANGVASLDSGGKVPVSELPAAVLGALSYQGTWNASTNTPTLASGVGTKGYYYVVSVAGSTNLDGITSWVVGDWAVYNGTAWQKVDNTDAVTSVNGYTGTVVLSQSDIAGTVPTSRTISAGTGLTGGGDLSADRTFAIDSTVATLTGTQTLTNKTVTSPKINEILDANGNEVLGLLSTASATDYVGIKNGIGVGVPLHISSEGSSANIGLHIQPKGTGLVTISDGTDFNKGIRFRSSSSAASAITLLDAVSTAGHVITLPDATTTLVGRNTTDTLTNKSISGATNTFSSIPNSGLTNSSITINGVAVSLGSSTSVGTVTSVTGTAPVVSSGGATPAISMAAATSSVDWYLTSTDWNTFNNKTSNTGTVTSVAASVPAFLSVSGSPITTSGTLAISYSGTALPVANGGTGATTLTGVVYGNGTSAFTAATGAQIATAIGATAVTNATNATNATNTGITNDAATAVAVYPTWVTANTGNLPQKTTSAALSFVPSTGTLSATVFSGSGASLSALNASNLSTGTVPGDRGVTAGSTTASFVEYNGTTATAGQFDGGVTTPTGTTRLNYGGYFYPTFLNLIGSGDTATAASHYFVENGSDGFVRPKTLANVQTEIVTTAAVNAAAATTVGTVGTGTWQATDIGLAYGGTNATLTAVNGGVVYSTASAMAITAAGTAGQVLTSNGAAAPTWAAAVSSNITTKGLYENAATISANYTIGSGNNAISAGPITVASGVTVTVPSGSVWTVV